MSVGVRQPVVVPITRNTSSGEPPQDDDMEARVKKLEDEMAEIRKDLKTLLIDSAEMKGMMRGMPSATSFGELKGRVDSLPTTAKVATLIAIAAGVVTIVTKWAELQSVLGP